MNIEDAIEYIKGAVLRNGERLNSNSDASKYYVGVTNDINRRQTEHNARFITFLKASTVRAACELEEALGKLGFDNGGCPGNGVVDDTRYVYIYKKGPETIEHIA